QPLQVVLDRLSAAVGQRHVVLGGAARVGSSHHVHRTARTGLLQALGVAVQDAGRLRRQRRLVEAEVNRLQRAGRAFWRRFAHAHVVHALFILRAIVVLRALCFLALALDALEAGGALAVALAGAATVGDALLPGGALRAVGAEAGDG